MIHSIRHWLCFALTICLLGACSEEIKSEVIPEEWITLITDDMTFAYEGGVDNRTFKLADGIDASSLTVSFSSNGEQWLTATLQNDAIQILCERSFTERGRSSVLTLAYDDNHKSSFTIRQDAAPDAADQLIRVVSAEATSEEADEYVIENYQSVISNLREVQHEFAAVISAAPPGESRERMQQMHNWAQLAVLLWEAQCHHLQGRLAAKAAVNSGDMRRRLEPIVNESIRNTREILALLPHFAPNMNLTEQHEGVITNNGSIHKETEKLNRKLEAMQRYLETKE